jgi:cellulose synthase/poly-beta-1,6-N-acetylglucosamine synthase-like glycosyltransferase
MKAMTDFRKTMTKQKLMEDQPKDFRFKRSESGLEYFPASIIEATDGEGDTHNDLRVFNHSIYQPDVEIDKSSLIFQMKTNKVKMLHCIVMYNENFGQFLQSFTGVVRSIIELINLPNSEYAPEEFGVVLIWDGIDKVDKDFIEKLIEFDLFDPKLSYNTYMYTDADGDHVALPIDKKETMIEPERPGFRPKKYQYATANVGHIFGKWLTHEKIEKMLDIKDEGDNEFIWNLHCTKKSPSEWVTNRGIYEIPDINFFFWGKHLNRGKIESHLWFFKGFCSYINPELCQMIDIGTIPLK